MQSFCAANFFLQPEMVLLRSQAVMSMANATQFDFDLAQGARRARIRSAWIMLRGEGIPRLASCYDEPSHQAA